MSDAALLAVSPPRLLLPSGTVVENRYRLERFVGQGATGCVFLATHVESGEALALKLMHPADPGRASEGGAGFLVAARAAARFRSDNVAHVRDMGMREQGSPYLVMEYLEGETLEAHLRIQPVPLPIARAVDIALQAARGLSDAHTAGLVHRNARPAKWFLSRTPSSSTFVKLLDFGGSKISPRGGGAESPRSNGSAPVGAEPYAAPEQLLAPSEVDARADVWTLGVVLHELLARAPPFRGATIREARLQALAAAPRALRARRGDLAPELEAVVMRCLEKNPDDRYASMGDVMLALAPFHGAWERSSVTPTPPPANVAVLTSTPTLKPPPPPAPVPEAVLPPLPPAIALAVAQAAETAPPEPPEPPAPEATVLASVSSVSAQPELPLPSATTMEAVNARILGLPRAAVVAAIGLLIGVGITVFLHSSERKPAALAQPSFASAPASASSPPAPSAPPAVAETAETPAPPPAQPPVDDTVPEPAPPPQAPSAIASTPAEPARVRTVKAASRPVASKAPPPVGLSAPVGTAGFGDRQ